MQAIQKEMHKYWYLKQENIYNDKNKLTNVV